MNWFLIGIVCIATRCLPVQSPETFESPSACLRESQVFVSQAVSRFQDHGLTRIKTWCTLGEDRRDEMMERLKRGELPAPRAKDA